MITLASPFESPADKVRRDLRDFVVISHSIFLATTPYLDFPGRADMHRQYLETIFGRLPY